MLNRILKGVLTAVFLVVTAIGTMVLVVHQENKSEDDEESEDFDPDSKMITRNKLEKDEDDKDSFQRVGELKQEQYEKKMKEKEKAKKLDKIAEEKAEKERQKELEKQRKLAEEKKRKEEEEKRILAEAKNSEEEAQKRVEEAKKKREVVQQQEKEKEIEKVVENENKITENKVAEEKEEKPQLASRGEPAGNWMNFEATFYGSDCYKCSGKTAMGIDVRNSIYHKGMRVIAVDPSIIPLGSIVEIKAPHGHFKAIAGDTGGRIKGHIVDILVSSEAESAKHGRQQIKIRVLK